jgi:ABC-type ATPase with predicted acetyltransferase domain
MNARGKWSTRAAIVARWFGVEEKAALRAAAKREVPAGLELRGGQIILLTGPSGAGKSTLLECLRRQYRRRAGWIDLQRVQLPRGALVIDVMAGAQGGGDERDEGAIIGALEALSRVGLGEVWSYLRTAGQLSEGQRWRLRLALGLAQVASDPGSKLRGLSNSRARLVVLAADEFAAPLDRITALVVARGLRKVVSARGDLCAVVATSHEDLAAALEPDVIVRCDFGSVEVGERGL